MAGYWLPPKSKPYLLDRRRAVECESRVVYGRIEAQADKGFRVG